MARALSQVSTSLSVDSSNLDAANSLFELAQSVKEKGLWIFGESESKRRVIKIEKREGSYGFTLQSYGVRYKHGNRETDFITYVNAVEKDGSAYHAGLREGDVILTINGQNMARVEHTSLVAFIRQCPTRLKMVVISDERARKVELHMRYVHLQKKLQDKMKELEQLNKTEKELLLGTFDPKNAHHHNGDNKLDSSCFGGGGDGTSSCCFCPGKPKNFLEEKERSKSMSSSTSKSFNSRHNKDQFYYDCYRKSQSTKELSTTLTTNNHDPINNSSIVGIQPAKKTQSGGELSALLNSTFPTSSGLCPPISSQQGLATSPSLTSNSGRRSTGPHLSKSPTPSSLIGGGESGQSQNLKSFGGYGFGFYSHYPSKEEGSIHSGKSHHHHHHFSHPHHHNHHTHCSNHPNQSYYYGATNSSKPTTTVGGGGHISSSSRRSSVDSSATALGATSGSRPFTNHTTYKIVGSGTTRVVARVTMGNVESSSTRTLPPQSSSASARSSSSSRHTHNTASTASASGGDSFTSGKLEIKTLSDSSLNSERHKDFKKYFRNSKSSENEDGNYSSDDDYDEYATEPNYGPKNDIYV